MNPLFFGRSVKSSVELIFLDTVGFICSDSVFSDCVDPGVSTESSSLTGITSGSFLSLTSLSRDMSDSNAVFSLVKDWTSRCRVAFVLVRVAISVRRRDEYSEGVSFWFTIGDPKSGVFRKSSWSSFGEAASRNDWILTLSAPVPVLLLLFLCLLKTFLIDRDRPNPPDDFRECVPVFSLSLARSETGSFASSCSISCGSGLGSRFSAGSPVMLRPLAGDSALLSGV
ncbi:hypothetical protein OGAPHI_005075 [Ogataea philodendri]|uniref:Uncharacterized protein n=1 Tax=Ogataea philodendri TaxID=1378263 RepID=A0A9P8P2U3_9ASCO|nr:uncharacterized protein OGAPHI_005075 [Ogataea philodendri]KAH3663674.1 hypothetical protein OGAPHI_005075 [Ogataea philodendri]